METTNKVLKVISEKSITILLICICIVLLCIHNDLRYEYPESDIIQFQSEMIDAQDDLINSANSIIMFKDSSTERLLEYRDKLQRVDSLWNGQV